MTTMPSWLKGASRTIRLRQLEGNPAEFDEDAPSLMDTEFGVDPNAVSIAKAAVQQPHAGCICVADYVVVLAISVALALILTAFCVYVVRKRQVPGYRNLTEC
ncbi:hypothetical protein AAVH_01281 [Aphelenchoides avenae]|nr:hypothetical protein AAVH_01281 [Aphelenchus avenae]